MKNRECVKTIFFNFGFQLFEIIGAEMLIIMGNGSKLFSLL